uniref:Uncharacterized protein n=1 Tax=Cucumis melo TaxID=3656 RepID=A0A9I9E3H0_CUCME
VFRQPSVRAKACKQPHPVLFVVVRRVPADAATVRFAGCCSPHRTAVVRRKKEPSKPWLPVFIQSDPRPASSPSREPQTNPSEPSEPSRVSRVSR